MVAEDHHIGGGAGSGAVAPAVAIAVLVVLLAELHLAVVPWGGRLVRRVLRVGRGAAGAGVVLLRGRRRGVLLLQSAAGAAAR